MSEPLYSDGRSALAATVGSSSQRERSLRDLYPVQYHRAGVCLVRERRPAWHAASVHETVLRILTARFGAAGDSGVDSDLDRRVPEPIFDLASFQAHAVEAAQRILDERRGVIIADSVGLGKTYIALGIVEGTLRRGGRVAVVAPAAVRREWGRPLDRLARTLASRARARHRLDPELYTRPAPPGSAAAAAPPAAHWISHTQLSRGSHSPERMGRLDLVVVDEAHAFRNPRTRRYRALAALCRGTRVVLLTATPVNNALMDLYHQIRLFAGDGAFRDLGIPDLLAAFRNATVGSGRSAAALAPVLGAVVIRRTRPFLRRHYGSVRVPSPRGGTLAGLPRRAPPVPIRYSLEDVRPGFHSEVAGCLDRLTLAPFRLGEYGMPFARGGGGQAELICLLLLKRLESSIEAFRLSARRQTRFYRLFIDALDAGRLLAPAEHQAMQRGDGDADVVQLILHQVALKEAPSGLDLTRLHADASADLRLLRALQRRLDESAVAAADPKLRSLERLLDEQVQDAKAVLFTEFRDTARYLWRSLVRRGRVGLVDGGGAFLGADPAGRRAVIERFAPRANDVAEPSPRERVDLLIATDVLAEGLNLQDAGTVISYDLPWNPVRLIQRIGRVDRLGSPFSTIRSYHFLPDHGLERLLRLVDRLRAKLTAIGRSVGAEAAVLGHGEIPAQDFNAFVDRLAAGDPDVLEDGAGPAAASSGADDRLRAAFHTLVDRSAADGRGARRGRTDGPRDSAPAAMIPGDQAAPHTLLLACEVGGRPLLLLFDVATRAILDGAGRAAELLAYAAEFAATHGDRPIAPMSILPSLIDRAIAALRPVIAAREAALRAAEPAPAEAPGVRLARRLLAALDAVPGDPDPSLCRRCDLLLPALARSHDAGTDDRLHAVLRAAPAAAEALGLIRAAEDALDLSTTGAAVGSAPLTDRARQTPAPDPRAPLLGILEVRPG